MKPAVVIQEDMKGFLNNGIISPATLYRWVARFNEGTEIKAESRTAPALAVFMECMKKQSDKIDESLTKLDVKVDKLQNTTVDGTNRLEKKLDLVIKKLDGSAGSCNDIRPIEEVEQQQPITVVEQPTEEEEKQEIEEGEKKEEVSETMEVDEKEAESSEVESEAESSEAESSEVEREASSTLSVKHRRIDKELEEELERDAKREKEEKRLEKFNTRIVKAMRRQCREGLKKIDEHEEETLAQMEDEHFWEKDRYLNKRKRDDLGF